MGRDERFCGLSVPISREQIAEDSIKQCSCGTGKTICVFADAAADHRFARFNFPRAPTACLKPRRWSMREPGRERVCDNPTASVG